jgi:hypothetical protein
MKINLDTHTPVQLYKATQLTKGATYQGISSGKMVLATQKGIVCLATGTYYTDTTISDTARYVPVDLQVIKA